MEVMNSLLPAPVLPQNYSLPLACHDVSVPVLPQHYSLPPTCRDVSVLIVDTDLQNLLNLRWMFQLCGYTNVSYVQSAEDALWLLRQTPVDILMCDAFLPATDNNYTDGGGFQLLSAVREFKSLQVILFSDNHDQNARLGFLGHDNEIAIRALELGACAFYRKPISMEIVQHLWQHAFVRKIQFCNEEIIAPRQSVSENLGPKSCCTEKGETQKKKKTKSKIVTAAKLTKGRIRWTEDLERKFGAAIEAIGRSDQDVTASRILGLMKGMGEKDLTLPQVSSHLQKYQMKNKTLFIKKKIMTPNNSSVDNTSSFDQCDQYNSSSVDQSTPPEQQNWSGDSLQLDWSDADFEELMNIDLDQLLSSC